MSEKKVNTKPVDYAALNQLSKDFETRFVPQAELSAEQAFWSRYSVQPEEPNLSVSTAIVEVLKELPKVSMVNSSLKKLKFYLASFDMVVKERTTDTAIMEGTNNSFLEQSAPTFDQLFEINNLKAQSQKKDTVIVKLKERLKSLSGNVQDGEIKRELEEIETINIELDHRVTKLVAENKHLKQTYKQLQNGNIHLWMTEEYDSIKSSCVRSKEQSLKETLSRLKGKAVVNEAVFLHSIDPELLKIDVAPLAPKLRNNRTAHTDYLRHTQEETATLREIVESERLINPLNTSLDYASQAQANDTLILNLKEKLNSLNGDVKDKDVIRNVEESETLNIELGHQVTKLATENNHLKQTYKQLYDSIKSLRVRSKEQCDNLIKKVNIKSAEVSDLNARLQEKVLVITALKEQLDKLKGKAVITEAVSLNSIDPKLLKVDVTPVVSKLLKPVVTLVYSRKSKAAKKKVPVSNLKINKSLVVQIVLWYLDSGWSKHMTGDRSQLINFVHKFLGTVKFGNDHVAKIMGYGDYKIGNTWKSLFANTLASFAIWMASKTKSWLWHRRLSQLNFGAINHLSRQGLVRGLPKLKFEKDHLCSACAMGKSTKKSHKPKSKDTNQEILYLLHMDLCGPMCVKSVNRKKYILVIVDDYSRFTWVKFLRSKDEAPDFIIKFLKMIQLRLKVSVRRKLQPKDDIGIFIGYAPTKKAFWIVETIHVDFDELTAMASEQSKVTSAQSSSTVSPHSVGQPDHQILQHISKWTKDHPLQNIIGQLSRPVSTWLQLHEQALFCYCDAFLTSMEPKTYKEALTQSCWIEAMQEELNEFE
nr:hypothetical protein [Tanacetum cinerariifolium]